VRGGRGKERAMGSEYDQSDMCVCVCVCVCIYIYIYENRIMKLKNLRCKGGGLRKNNRGNEFNQCMYGNITMNPLSKINLY
jgi:hypothetical protein